MISPFSTIKEIRSKIKNKEITPSEVFKFYQSRSKELNSEYNAFIDVFDAPIEPTVLEGKLGNIPCAIKENLCIKDRVTTAGSSILKNFKPSYNAEVVDKIKAQGGLILGKANMDEFAMGASGEFSAFGAAKNPWDKTRTPGGSSSGSAAAVAAGMVPWAMGSETGGSLRQPASYCGLVGMYPTYGLVSRFGLLAFGSSLDQPGPICRTVHDTARIMSVIAGHDPKDSTSLPEPRIDYTKNLDGRLPHNLKIGVIKESLSGAVDPEIKEMTEHAIKTLESMGCTIKTIEMPSFKFGLAVYFIISRAEAASNLSRIDGTLYGMRTEKFYQDLEELYVKTRSKGFGAEVKRRILLGNYVLSSDHRDVFERANLVRNMIRNELDAMFEDVDLLFSPTTSNFAFKLNEAVNDPMALYLGDYFVLPNCVAGFPAISIPAGLSKAGLPAGVQFIGPRLSEELLFKAAYALEQELRLSLQPKI